MSTEQQGMFDEIPVIDVSPLLDDSESGLREVAGEIDFAYSQVGFGLITNHGVDQSLIDNVFAASREFHAQSFEQKMQIEINEFQRGFLPIRSGATPAEAKPNQCDSFMILHELAEDDPDVLAGAPMAGPNQWPAGLPGFREKVTAYEQTMHELGMRLVRAIAVALGADPYDLDRHFEHPTTFLRLLHYPPLPPGSPSDLFGSAPHTDYGFVTILAQDDVGGLQVGTTDGKWIDVPCIPGSFVVNTADVLHRWSNRRFISTPHRVISDSEHHRYSVGFFFDPDLHTEIVPLPSRVSPENPASSPVIYGEYLMQKLSATIKSGGYPEWEEPE